jgi:hypothetical protein
VTIVHKLPIVNRAVLEVTGFIFSTLSNKTKPFQYQQMLNMIGEIIRILKGASMNMFVNLVNVKLAINRAHPGNPPRRQEIADFLSTENAARPRLYATPIIAIVGGMQKISIINKSVGTAEKSR